MSQAANVKLEDLKQVCIEGYQVDRLLADVLRGKDVRWEGPPPALDVASGKSLMVGAGSLGPHLSHADTERLFTSGIVHLRPDEKGLYGERVQAFLKAHHFTRDGLQEKTASN
ncbi:MAG: hypothetical protein SFT92_03065 [Rickettsiales bacterium]|nr:hypothetical protein [Rickettsiales bacterium]